MYITNTIPLFTLKINYNPKQKIYLKKLTPTTSIFHFSLCCVLEFHSDTSSYQCLCKKITNIKHIGARTFPARSFPPDGTTFGQITLGQKLTKEIQPYSYWNMQFYQSEPAYVKFDYTIPRGASIGVYGRRNALPTHTQYHFKEVLSGFSASTRSTRAAHVSIFIKYVVSYSKYVL